MSNNTSDESSDYWPSRVNGQTAEYLVQAKLASMGYKTLNADHSFYDIFSPRNMARIEVKSCDILTVDSGSKEVGFTMQSEQLIKGNVDYVVLICFTGKGLEHRAFIIPQAIMIKAMENHNEKRNGFGFTMSDSIIKNQISRYNVFTCVVANMTENQWQYLTYKGGGSFARMRTDYTKRISEAMDIWRDSKPSRGKNGRAIVTCPHCDYVSPHGNYLLWKHIENNHDKSEPHPNSYCYNKGGD